MFEGKALAVLGLLAQVFQASRLSANRRKPSDGIPSFD